MSEYNSELASAIGRNLRARRREVYPKDTQRDMAARLGIGLATYSRIERGDATVSFRHYLAAARLLHCEQDFRELFTHPDRREGLIEGLLRERGDGR